MDKYLISKYTLANGEKNYRITRTEGKTKKTILKESQSVWTLHDWIKSLEILKIPFEIEEIKRTIVNNFNPKK